MALVRTREASLECARINVFAHPAEPQAMHSNRAADAALTPAGDGPALVELPWAACVAVRGDDAEDFLRRQLTQNPPIDTTHFTLAAWNDARGRVRAVLRVLRDEQGFVMVCERDGLDTLLARLRMFVLRSKVELTPLDGHVVAAVLGADSWLHERGVPLGDATYSAAPAGGVTWLRVGDGVVHVVGPQAAVHAAAGTPATAPEPAQAHVHAAELAEIRLGWPRVPTALVERFVPQMLNLDRLGGIAFDKGCYPGQEVVARLHHLGQVKRRLQRFVADGPADMALPAAGDELRNAGGEAVADVVRAARSATGAELLAVAPVDGPGGPLSAAGSEPAWRPVAVQ